MTGGAADPEAIAAALAVDGLTLRGGFRFETGEAAPVGRNGKPAQTLILVGHGGPSHWLHSQRWLDERDDRAPDPLDRWTRTVVGSVAADFGLSAAYPFEQPYHPFQKWAARAEGLRPSPLGILIHPVFGTWHAYRAALLSEAEISIPLLRKQNHPCDACVGKPCLSACPVDAHSAAGFAYADCLSHVRSDDGAPCMTGGCLARNACPVGTEFRYPREMQAFHQRAFAGA